MKQNGGKGNIAQSISKNMRMFIVIVIAIIFASVAVLASIKLSYNNQKTLKTPLEETKQMDSYREITDEDAEIENCPYVQFSSFFTKDLDGNGYAEKYDGVSNPLDKKQTLWFDINVLTDGTLKNGTININGKNFTLETTLIKDDFIANDYVSKNTPTIALKDIKYGSQKLFCGQIAATIGNNINNYSVNNNTVTLTGTWVSTDGTTEIPINKQITLKTDWYGKTSTTSSYVTSSHYIDSVLGTDYVTLTADVRYRETAEELLLQKQVTEVEIPEFNGYLPEQVIVTSQNCTYEYDQETKKLTITREAEVNESGNITKSISRDNIYTIKLVYPIVAYENLGAETITLSLPTVGYYYGYNNSNESLEHANPYISSATATFTHTWRKYIPPVSVESFSASIGRYTYDSDTKSYKYIVSKEKPIKIYNNYGLEEGEIDKYIVEWEAFTGERFENQNGIHLTETDSDKLKNKNGEYTNFKEYVSTTGIYFSNLSGILSDDGWLKVYNNETGDLLETFTKENWSEYSSSNPYMFKTPVKSIRVETSKASNNSYLHIYQIKEIDDIALTENMTREVFDVQDYIYTYLTAGLFNNETKTVISNPVASALYQVPVSCVNFEVTPEAISNQETKKLKMNISTICKNYNEEQWKNGMFVIELPEELLEVVVNSVTSSNSNVKITSYETYTNDGKNYIKIYTSNDTETTYSLSIDADVTADPRRATTTKAVKLYAINQNCHNYRDSSRIKDTLDINSNSNTEEYILYKTANLQIIAPTSLLTSQTLSNFDDEGTEVVSPQIAVMDKSDNSRDANVNITITNNYTGTISEPVIIGKIPFKGNKYQINGNDLGSTYSVTMKDTGITVPDRIKDKVTVYYSKNETVTNDLTDPNNNFVTADQVTDWSAIKNFAIDLSQHTLSKGETIAFSYQIAIPNTVKYNDVAFSTHAVYFCLDTADGKLRNKTEVNRLGIMIAKKYDLNITKYKLGTERKVQGATYKVSDGTNSRTGITDINGNTLIEGLYVDKEYTLEEIATTDSYILNTNKVTFKITVDAEGNPQITKTGDLREEATIENIEGKYRLNLTVEDEAKYDVKIVKTGDSGEKIKGVKYKLTGGVYGEKGRIFTTNADGEISIISLIPGVDYTLQETKATGYYVKQEPMTFSITRNASGNVEITSEANEISTATVNDTDVDKAVINVNLVDEKIPTYTLKLLKKNDKGEVLANTQFKLTSVDTGETTYITTNEEGIGSLDGLYQYVEGKYVEGTYILQEIVATEGYITDSTEVKFKTELKDVVVTEGEEAVKKLEITILEGETAVKSQESDATSITLGFENKPVFKLTKKGDNAMLLPNTKFIVTDLDGNSVTDIDGNPIGKLEGSAPFNLVLQSAIGTPSNNTSSNQLWKQREDGTWESGVKAIANGRSALISKEFTINQTATLSFEWAVSSESLSYDYVYYTITNLDTGAKIGGDVTGYKIGGNNTITNYNNLVFATVEKELAAGRYTIEFMYRKDGSSDKGLDAGFVKNAKVLGSGQYVLTTDKNGELTANLPSGMYKIIEIEAPEGYELPEDEEARTHYIGIGESRPEQTEFNIKWSKAIQGKGHGNIYDTLATSDGGYIVCGSYRDVCDLDQDGTVDLTSVYSFDGLVVKYDEKGNILWHYELGSDGSDEFYGISATADGYIVAGNEGKTGAIVKLDNNGNVVWKKNISSSIAVEVKNVKSLSTGDIVIAGRFNGTTLDVDGNNLTNKGLYDGFVATYNSDGTFKRLEGIQGTNNINVTDIAETSVGYVVSADFLGSITVNGATVTSKGNQDAILIGFLPDGTYSWHQVIGGSNDESIIRLETDNEDNVWAIGGFASNLTIGTETITAPTTSYSNGIALKYSAAAGEYISNYIFGGTAGDEKLTSAFPTDDGGMLLGGWYSSSSFDTNKDGTNDVTSNKGLYDGILIKLNDANEVEWTRTIQGNQFDTVTSVVQLNDKTLIVCGNSDSSNVSSGSTTNFLVPQGYMDAFMINLGSVVTAAEVPLLQEVEVNNELKKFKVTTEIGENSDTERVGGTITGTETATPNVNFVEEVKYAYDSTQQIVITPSENYSIYSIEIDSEKITTFTPDENGVVIIPVFTEVKENHHVRVVFEKNLSSVIVHHYLKDREGNLTTTKLAEDDYISGKIGSKYTTSPKVDIEGYELAKKIDNVTYDIPANAAGEFEVEQQVVTYYYEEIPFTLTVHHYIEGTETRVPLETGGVAEDEVSTLYKNTEYTTQAKAELLESYNLLENLTRVSPDGAGTSGNIQEDTVVTYYYKLKEYDITTKVNPITITKYDENTGTEQEVTVKGGTISGEDERIYETVRRGEDSTKEIKVTPDEGYLVKRITVNGTEIEFTENADKTVTLDTFTNVMENKEVIVEFEPQKGNVIVHHYIYGTTRKVSLADGTEAEDENKTRYVGDQYVTKPKENLAEGFEYDSVVGESSGRYIDGTIEVIYYYRVYTDIDVVKKWDHTNNIYGKPENVTIELYAGETKVREVTLTESNKITVEGETQEVETWKYTFEKVLKYDDTGNEIDYKIAEKSKN